MKYEQQNRAHSEVCSSYFSKQIHTVKSHKEVLNSYEFSFNPFVLLMFWFAIK